MCKHMQNENPELTSELPPEIVQVGRQPILDRNQQVYGYELLYRSDDEGPGAGFDGNYITAHTVLNSFLEFGMQRLVGPHRVFINLTRTFFTDLQPPPIDKQRLVLEFLEDIELEKNVIEGVRSLHERGFVVALDDFRFEPRWDAVLPYCQIVKVEVTGLDLDAFAPQISALKSRGLLLLAEKVETREVFDQAMRLGFDLFQGYFFAKPQILSTTRLQTNQILLLKMIARINDSECSIEELAALVAQDSKLSFKILRFINSAAIGLPRKVDSIKQAVVFVGMRRLRAWANLFVMAGMNNKTPEILTTSLIRAEFCQSLSKELKVGDPDSGYTVGLFSMLDAILDQPMSELVKDLPLPEEMVEALVNHTGTYSEGLNCVIALEHGAWNEAGVNMLPQDKLNSIYVDAMIKAEEISRELS